MIDPNYRMSITLAGQEYPIGMLKLRQMVFTVPALRSCGIGTPAGVQAQISVIQAAIAAKDASMTNERLLDLEGVTVMEIVDAVEHVAIMLGFRKEAPPGEAVAVADR